MQKAPVAYTAAGACCFGGSTSTANIETTIFDIGYSTPDIP
jgi:hypothetical protein